ncbi:MAG: hypothetical protein HYZ27_04890, partial [Deltaproteobacteria bacterium]|nr:hypothetical protein [Deltaproteobacteria bacterium]
MPYLKGNFLASSVLTHQIMSNTLNPALEVAVQEGSSGPAATRAMVNYTLAMGCKLYSQLRALDLRRYELLSAERAVEESLTGGFAQVRHWAAAVSRLLAGLPDAVGAPADES